MLNFDAIVSFFFHFMTIQDKDLNHLLDSSGLISPHYRK